MVSLELRERLRAVGFTQRILWFALTAAIVMYVGVGDAIVAAGGVGGDPLPEAASTSGSWSASRRVRTY